MNVIIVGLGRMGTGLAIKLSKQGIHVTAIDKDPETFEGLGKDFAGETVQGVGFDHDVLEKAGIDRTDAVIACTASDEANIVVAHVSRSVFRVPRVIARLYDTNKADTYRRLDIQTISTTDWGIRRASELLTYHKLDTVYGMGHDGVRLVRADVPTLFEGQTVKELTALGEIQIVAISRSNDTFIPTQGTVFEHGDIIYAAVAYSASDKFSYMLGLSE
ncbi:MAG: TrkA family potassium uptake protein [Atopobium sp.]|nr:TrkA family potassium uptake protein [Atopobium sp.]